MKKIAFVLSTHGLEYDDRIRKEVLTLSKHADVEIYLITPDNNEQVGTTSYGVKYYMFKLKIREWLPSGKFLILKAISFFLKVKKHLKDYDVVWVHDEEPCVIPLLYKHRRIVWDLHELPLRFEKYTFMKTILRRIEQRTFKILHANPFRKEYCFQKGLFRDRGKHAVLRNYPDEMFVSSNETDDKYGKFKRWLGGSDYVYLQGLQERRRLPIATIEAVLKAHELKAVVVGSFDKYAKTYLENEYGDMLHEKVFFCGRVDQLMTVKYIKNSKFSIVLYDIENPNFRYCEPNRMYQVVVFGKPVIVGRNEPMSDVVSKNGFGISLKTEGKDVDEIVEAINLLRLNYKTYLVNIKANKHKIMWAEQEHVLSDIISRL